MRIFCQISIHALRVEGDSHKYITYTDLARISIHALRVEGDSRYLPSKLRTPTYFYPRPPGGGRPVPSVKSFIMYIHFYPRPPGGGRRNTPELSSFMQGISIHALRVEGDCGSVSARHLLPDFYPRPPGGGRPDACLSRWPTARNFYPRPPGGGRLTVHGQTAQRRCISIHALRVEGDMSICRFL